jgi:hypothetical protein
MSEGPSPDDQMRPSPDDRIPAEPGGGERTCVGCGAPLAPDQDWCLQCGSGKTTGRSGPGWRSAAAAVGVATVLALGAAAAAYAAFKGEPGASTPPSAVAQTPPATTTTTTTTTTSSATTPAVITPEAGLPAEHKPPKIPATSSTPQTGGTTSEEGGSSSNEQTGASSEREQKSESSEGSKKATRETEEQTCSSSSTGESEASTQEASELEGETSSAQTTGTETQAEEAEEAEDEESCTSEAGKNGSKPAPIQLSARDASSYDPNAYPETGYVGPELAVDGNASTAWTAAPAPEIAPKVQAGLLIDLTRERQIAKVALISRTLGMTVAIYGTTQRTAPKSVESKGWVKLSGVHLVEQRSSTIKLERTPRIRQLLVWVLRAPEVEPQVEGEAVEESAAINELALYEPLR